MTGSGGTLPAADFFPLAKIPAASFAKGSTWLLALTGCQKNDVANAVNCGTDYSLANGNVAMDRVQLDRLGNGATAGPAFEFVNVSDQAASTYRNGLYGAVFGSLGSAATRVDIGSFVPFGFGTTVPVVVPNADPARGGFAVYGADPDAGSAPLTTESFAQAWGYFTGTPTPTPPITPGAAYTFVYLGNPNVAAGDAGAPGTAGHFLVFPNDLAVPSYP